MKNVIAILLLILSQSVFCFNYSNYVKNYLDNVEGTPVRDGICYSLVEDMFSEIEDKMLIDVSRGIWGHPVDFPKTGDIMIYSNHIVIVYDVKDGKIFVGQQNVKSENVRGGDTSKVSIDEINFNLIKDVVQIFRPVKMEDVDLDESKKFLMKLYTINVYDTEKMNRGSYDVTPSKYKNQYIVDPTLRYTKIEFDFALYYKGKVLTDRDNNISYIRTPYGKMIVEHIRGMEWKPIKYKNSLTESGWTIKEL